MEEESSLEESAHSRWLLWLLPTIFGIVLVLLSLVICKIYYRYKGGQPERDGKTCLGDTNYPAMEEGTGESKHLNPSMGN